MQPTSHVSMQPAVNQTSDSLLMSWHQFDVSQCIQTLIRKSPCLWALVWPSNPCLIPNLSWAEKLTKLHTISWKWHIQEWESNSPESNFGEKTSLVPYFSPVSCFHPVFSSHPQFKCSLVTVWVIGLSIKSPSLSALVWGSIISGKVSEMVKWVKLGTIF
jgi:hypothetical protein